MEECISWFYEKRAEAVCQALKKNRMNAVYVPDTAAVADAVMSLVPEGAVVGMGGSMTVTQAGVLDALRVADITLLDRFAEGLAPEERFELCRKSLLCDVFISGVNAITEDGELVFVDASCTRVAHVLFGPKKVILVAGMNKLCPNLENAQERIRFLAAPVNAKRLNRATPCAQTGQCADCNSPDRICNATVVVHKQSDAKRLTVILVGADLGL